MHFPSGLFIAIRAEFGLQSETGSAHKWLSGFFTGRRGFYLALLLTY